MTSAGFFEANNHLSERVERSSRRERILITCGSERVAHQMPPRLHRHRRSGCPTATGVEWEARVVIENRGLKWPEAF